MNKQTVHAIRTLKDPNSRQYHWMPGILFGTSDTLLGVPLHTSSAIPEIEKGNDIIIYGDFKTAYLIVDKNDMRFQSNQYTAKPKTIIYAVKNVGGSLVNAEALKVLQINKNGQPKSGQMK